MEIISDIFVLVLFLSLLTSIIYGVRWFKLRKRENDRGYRRSKRFTIISLVMFIVSFWAIGVNEDYIDQQKHQEQVEKKRETIDEYEENKFRFRRTFASLGIEVEELSKNEGKDWHDAVINEGDNFNAETAVKKIEDNRQNEITEVQELTEKLHQLDLKIQRSDYPSKNDKETFHEAYLNLKHFAVHATDLGGSYGTFVEEHNELDRKMADSAEALEDMD